MNKKELETKINELKQEISGLYKLALSLGNKNPQNNFMIRDRFELLQKLEKELKGVE